jgi:transcriptional regulator NrdR family protein
MLCPTCHGPSRILETRLTGPDLSRKRRRHQCCDDECGYRFTTLELEDGPALRDFLAKRTPPTSPQLQRRLAAQRSTRRSHPLFE